MPAKIPHMEMSCLDLLPPTACILSALKMLNFILDNVIQSQAAFYQEGGLHFFDPYVSKDSCEIRAVNLLLGKTHVFKSTLEQQYQTTYFQNMKIRVNENISHFLNKNHEKQITNLVEFLKKNELIILMGLIDKYIFITYFLTTFRKKTLRGSYKIDYDRISKCAKITKKQAKTLGNWYQEIISSFSRNIIIMISENITDRKKYEKSLQLAKKQAQAANRAKIEFLENMRHDIRTPLTGIIGFSRLIQTESTNPRIKDYADNLVLATTALLDFQNEILEAIKVKTDSDLVIEETFHLTNLIEKVLNLVRPKAIIKNLELTLVTDDQLPQFVCGDSKRLFRIVLELVTNALKFTARGHIQIKLSSSKINQDQLTLCCEISDTGIGIPQNKIDDVFVRFHRLSPSSDGVYEGTGLGLTVVKKYIKDLRGKITVNSIENEGTKFICFIPLSFGNETIEKTTQTIDTSPSNKLFSHKNLLLIEDHTMTATVTQLMLHELGCTVEIASDAKTAILKSQEKKYDLIFMDLGLPDYDGFTLAKKIRAQENNMRNKTKIIALTAHKEEDVETRCVASAINAIYQKPLLKSEAINILNVYCTDDAMQNKIIDLELGAKRLNRDEITAKSMIDLLLKNIDHDQENIIHAYQNSNWKSLGDSNHKLMGGLAYCGTPRLEFACQQLQSALKKSDEKNTSHIHECVQTLLSEIQALKSACLECQAKP